MPDAHKNFATSLVATAPSPATTGTSLVVTAAEGTRFPAVPFNAVVCPADAQPTPANAEIVRVTAISTDTFTITRGANITSEDGGLTRSIVVGDRIYVGLTVAVLAPIETRISRTTKASNYTVLPADLGSLIDCTATATITIQESASWTTNPVSGSWFEVRRSISAGTTTVACTGAAVIRDPTTGATTTSVALGLYETVRFTESGDDLWVMTGRYDPDIQAIGQLTSAADKGIQFTGAGTAATFDLTTAGKALIDDASATAQINTLGGTSGKWTDSLLTSPNNSSYRTIALASTRVVAGTTVGDYWVAMNGTLVVSGGTSAPAGQVVHLVAADYAVGGLTTKLRVRMVVTTNATACTVNIVPGLYPLSSVAGGASLFAFTLGTVTSGSTKTFTAPAASSVLTDNSGDFTFPTDGVYVLGANVSGTTAASSNVGVQLSLQVRAV